MKHLRLCLGIACALILVLTGIPSFALNWTLSGVVTSDATGNPPVAGALVRTEGEPGYSTTTGSDGYYSLIVPQGPNGIRENILVSAPGLMPVKHSVWTSFGANTGRNFVLHTVVTGNTLSMPAPLDWGAPPAAPAPPRDIYSVKFADMAALPNPNAPQISGWHDTVKPDESFTLTGRKFTTNTGADTGTDTIVWVWARTSDSGGVLKQARVWKVVDNLIVATMPDDVPYGMYLVWVENSQGVSSPICINRTTAKWVGPQGNTASAGDTKRIFGVNISHNRGTGAGDASVYIQSGTSTMIPCTVTSVDPYSIAFTVPNGLANGSYQVYVHNGHGGDYGWAEGLDLNIQSKWVRGSTEQLVSASGGNDTAAVQSAINAMAGQTNGGTVRLGAGTFHLYNQLSIPSLVRLVGAGMSATTIELRQNGTWDPGYHVTVSGSHNAIEELTLKACIDTAVIPSGGIITSSANYSLLRNMKLTADDGTILNDNSMAGGYSEVDGCVFDRMLNPGGNSWVHDSTMHGGPYAWYWGPVNYETEAAFYLQSRVVYENNTTQTMNWPVNPIDGSKNYFDFMTYAQVSRLVWAKRVMYGYYNIRDTYIAHNTAIDVAVDDNKGEMILFHGGSGLWFGNVLSSNDLTINLRTDGLVDGQVEQMSSYSWMLTGGQPVPDYWFNEQLDWCWAVIVEGKGFGQARLVMNHTSTSITVEKPWRIQPDSTSKIVIEPLYHSNAVYDNDLSAFPVGYTQKHDSASCGVDFDGYQWASNSENNTSRRTTGGGRINATCTGPSFWTVSRNDVALSTHDGGFSSITWEPNPYWPNLVGIAWRGGQAQVLDSAAGGGIQAHGMGCIVEGMTLNAKMGYDLEGVAQSGCLQNGFILFRNGTVNAVDGPGSPAGPQPVYISNTDGMQFLINNTYSGGAQNYTLASGLSAYSIPVALNRVAKFTAYAGQPARLVVIPIANAGISSLTWGVTPSDSWISAAVQSNATLQPESDMGRLLVNVNTSGLSTGRHTGYVTISTGSTTLKVGVCLDVLSGSPPNAAPRAQFTATPAAGAVPFAVTFDAGASSDADGSIASYRWDFGDRSFGTGVTAPHTYTAAGIYSAVLTVEDDDGATDAAVSNITAAPALTGVTLSGSPGAPVATSTPVTLTATAIGGYQVQYKFLVKGSAGWVPLTGYQSGNTCLWTPTTPGYYEARAYARNTGSLNAYDIQSNIVGYPVGLVSQSGMSLWLKSDSGITKDASNGVAAWADQSGLATPNNVAQSNSGIRPIVVDGVANGKPVVRFNSQNQILQSSGLVQSGTGSFTCFAAVTFNSVPANANQYVFWNGDASSGYGMWINTFQKLRTGWGGGSYATITSSSAALTSQLYVIGSRFTAGTNHQVWINGNLTGTGARTTSNFGAGVFSVGNNSNSSTSGMTGDVAEILIYSRALSDAEVTSVGNYLSSKWGAVPVAQVDRLKDALALGDGAPVSIRLAKTATVASGTFSDGGIYIQEIDRTCGMKVLNAGTVGLWDSLTITGTMDTDVSTGERILRASLPLVAQTAGADPGTLGMANKAFSAQSPASSQPSGQLLRVWGKVKEKTSTYLTLDDGSGAAVKVEIDGLVTSLTSIPSIGDYVSVSGPAGLMTGGTPAIRVRSGADIHVY